MTVSLGLMMMIQTRATTHNEQPDSSEIRNTRLASVIQSIG
jgi:hypothetical protein